MNIDVIGVIGAGVMGTGVAQNLAQVGYSVVLVDRSERAVAAARNNITQALRFQSFFNKSERKETAAETLARIDFGTDPGNLSHAGCLIENVTENWEIKREVYTQLEAICGPECIFIVNTSAISITQVGSVTKRPDKVIGIHFMNPVPKKDTVELIRGYHTSDKTLEHAKQLLQRMQKNWVLVNDSPGFVSNRVLMLTINEAIFLLQENIASPEDVDRVFKSCFGHPMGPLETADLIGVDTILYSLEVLYNSFNDPKFRPCPLLKKMVDAGLWGRKSGRGFYSYEAN
jgi:3-hydroxybutyryl-CoA dehydrogenase